MNHLSPEQREALFPAQCHIKIIARDEPTMQRRLLQALQSVGVTQPPLPGNRSAAGTYITYNLSIEVQTYTEMQAIDGALRGVEGVRLVL